MGGRRRRDARADARAAAARAGQAGHGVRARRRRSAGSPSAWSIDDAGRRRHLGPPLPRDPAVRLGAARRCSPSSASTPRCSGSRRRPATTPTAGCRRCRTRSSSCGSPGCRSIVKLRLGAHDPARLAREGLAAARAGVGRDAGCTGGRARATFERFWLPLLRAKLGESWPRGERRVHLGDDPAPVRGAPQRAEEGDVRLRPRRLRAVLERFADGARASGASRSAARRRVDADRARRRRAGGRVRRGRGRRDVRPRRRHERRARPRRGCARASTEAERARLARRSRTRASCARRSCCASPLSDYYLTNIIDDLPFTAVIEMTALVDPAQLGGHALVYLPKYVGARRPAVRRARRRDRATGSSPGCSGMYPSFDRADVARRASRRVRHVFPIPTARLLRARAADAHERAGPAPGQLGAHRQRHAQRQRDRRAGRARGRRTIAGLGVSTMRAAAGEPRRLKPIRGRKPLASLSLDLDNQWSYLKTHGDAGWDVTRRTSTSLVPARARRARAPRAARSRSSSSARTRRSAENRDALGALAAAGHEIGNHSFHHEPWLHLYSEAELDDELARAEDAIEAATGVHPDGLPRPGLQPLADHAARCWSAAATRTTRRRCRLHRPAGARLLLPHREAHRRAAGRARAAVRHVVRRPRARCARTAGRSTSRTLLEIPVTTLPGLKVPIHVSYLLILSAYSPAAGARVLRHRAARLPRRAASGRRSCCTRSTSLAATTSKALAFFPGMQIPATEKLARVELVPRAARSATSTSCTVGEHAAAVAVAARRCPVARRLRAASCTAPRAADDADDRRERRCPAPTRRARRVGDRARVQRGGDRRRHADPALRVPRVARGPVPVGDRRRQRRQHRRDRRARGGVRRGRTRTCGSCTTA